MRNVIGARQRVRQEDLVLAAELAELYANQHTRVLAIVKRRLRVEDHAQAEDLAQDAWLAFWQYLLRGNEVRRPAALIAVFARRRVSAHYRSARVRREQVTDPQSAALDRLVAWIGEDIEREDDEEGYEEAEDRLSEVLLRVLAAGGGCAR